MTDSEKSDFPPKPERVDQGVDFLHEGRTLRCPLCGATVMHAIGPVLCVGFAGGHVRSPRAMEPVE